MIVVVSSRTLKLLIVLLIAAAPAVALRAVCEGRACDEPEEASADAPFCSLSTDIRNLIERGFREGRAPDVLAVTGDALLTTGNGVRWPSASDPATDVPIVLAGAGVDREAMVPAGTRVDAIAPTLAEIMGLRRPHPEVRSGRAIPGVASSGTPSLVLLVALKGVGSSEAEEIESLQDLVKNGAGTMAGDTGSLPADPVAVMTSIGTGGLPYQHGLTAALIRTDEGRVTRAWGSGSPVSVIAALGDDLDQQLDQRPLIGLAGTESGDRGLIGGNWYLDVDRDEVVLNPDSTRATERLLARGFGRDETPDLLAVALEGPSGEMDTNLRRLIELATERTGRGSLTVAVAGTGSAAPPGATTDVDVVESIESEVAGSARVMAASTAGGFFLDQQTLSRERIAQDEILDAMRSTRTTSGEPLFADLFSGFAVSFARFC
ncbi:MAG: hypothetical protein ACRDJS_00995 [Actinomycetota bacterium]